MKKIKQPDAVISEVALMLSLKPGDILRRGRHSELVMARMMITAILREKPYSMSYNAIGRYLRRDHTTVMDLWRRSQEVNSVKLFLTERKREHAR